MRANLVEHEFWLLGVYAVIGAFYEEKLCIWHFGGDDLGIFLV